MSIDAGPRPTRTRPREAGRVLSFVGSLLAWVWRLGDAASVVPLFGIAAGGLLAVQLGRTIHDVDIFWQLKLGDITLAHGLPRYEPFIAGREHEPLAVVAWLSQVVYAAVRQLGGWTLLWLTDGLLWFGGFLVVATSCARQGRNVWPAVLALWLGWLAAVPAASLRPQSFAALAFGLLLVLIRSGVSPRRTAALGAILFVCWQNLHPSVVVGGAVVAAAVLAELVQFWRGRRPTIPWRLIVLLPVAAVSTLATPAGFDIFRISAENTDVSRYLGVAEWQPLTWEPFEYGRPLAWAVLGLSIMGVLFAGRRLDARTFAAFGVLTTALLLSHRFVLFWGIAAVPFWYELLTPVPQPAADRPTRRSSLRLLLSVLAVSASVVGPLAFKPAPFADYYPFAGVRALRATGVRGTIYCSYYWGGLVAEAGYPDWRVTRDGRYYLFTRREWDEYFAEIGGELPPLVEKHHPAAFFLRPGSDDHLIGMLAADPAWRVLFADANCFVSIPAAIR